MCGSGDGTAEGFGFTGGIGGFGFMILESRCSHFKQEKMAGPIKHVNPNIKFKKNHLLVLLQVVAEVWMEVVAYPDKKKRSIELKQQLIHYFKKANN